MWSWLFPSLGVNFPALPFPGRCALSLRLDTRRSVSRFFWVGIYSLMISSVAHLRLFRIPLVLVGLIFLGIIVLLGLIDDDFVKACSGCGE